MKNKPLLQLCLFLAFFLSSNLPSLAQDIATYVDKHGRFKVFDAGEIQDLEHHEIKEIMYVGGGYVLYRDITNNIQYYQNGETINLSATLAFSKRSKLFPAQSMIGVIDWANENILKVYYNGEEELLTVDLADDYFEFADSIAVFFDTFDYFSVFYNGETEELTGRFPAKNYKLSFNTLAYIDPADVFRIYHHGEVTEVYHREPFLEDTVYQYHVGDNFIAYLSEEERLMVYDAGKTKNLTNFPPDEYLVGDKMVAYLTDEGAYNVYWNNQTKELSARLPKFHKLVNNTLAYADDLGNLKVFDKGRNEYLETYIPEQIEVFDGIVVYTDSDNRLKAYYEGKKLKVSEEIVTDFRLEGRVIIYTIGNNETKIFYKGKRYSG